MTGPKGGIKYQAHQLRNHVAKATGKVPKTIGRWIQDGSTYSLLGGAGALSSIFLESL